MITDLRNGVINCVIVKSVSRIGRNYILVGDLLIKDFANMGVRFISIINKYDSNDDDDDGLPRLDLLIQTVLDERTSRDTSKKVKSAISAKVNSGEFLPAAGSIPYGYLRDAENNTYVIDDETYLVVRKIYSMRAERSAISAIVNYLNEKGVPSPSKIRYLRGLLKDEKYNNSQWNRTTVRKILNDIAYVGHRVHGRKQKESYNSTKKVTSSETWTIIKDAHPAIISQELFDRVQEINQEEQEKLSKQEKRAEVVKDYREVFRGKIVCADCGKPMLAKKSSAKEDSNKNSYVYYECSSYYLAHQNCTSHYIREDAIVFELVSRLERCAETVLSPVYRKNKVDVLKKELVCIRKQILDIRSEKEKLSQEFMRFFEQYNAEQISAEKFRKFTDANKEKMFSLDEKEQTFVAQMNQLDSEVDNIENYIKSFKTYQVTKNLDKAMLDAIIERISINKEKNIDFCFKYNSI